MNPYISIENVTKTYSDGVVALNDFSLSIESGEIFALLGPNGAGKTTLISLICGLSRATKGKILIDNLDTIKEYKKTRALVGLVPQELTLENYETVWDTVVYSRGLFGKSKDSTYLEKVLKDLSLWDKKDSPIITLSGGMKRRVLIAKALSHNPTVLFLDEPTAGVDVQLRREMWDLVLKLRDQGVTTILTTHYIQEAEEIADRIGVINDGKLILVDNKKSLLQKMGQKELHVELKKGIKSIPSTLSKLNLTLSSDGKKIVYKFDKGADRTGITKTLNAISKEGLIVKDLETHESSLEDIFLSLIKESNL